MAESQKHLGVDIGGTKILAVLFDQKFSILEKNKKKVEPNEGEKHFFKTLISSIEGVLDEGKTDISEISSIGLGCPGMIDFSRGVIKLSPNLSFLENYSLKEKVEDYFKKPVTLENDVNAGIYGEQQFGAAKNFQNVVGVFMGTGVGGGLIFNGELYRGSGGAAGEIGHMFMNLPSFLDTGEKFGTLEDLTGRLKISSEAVFIAMKQQAPHLYQEIGTDAGKIKSKVLLSSIENGDNAVHNLLFNKAQIIGVALANLVNILNPDRIVLGGGLVEALESLIVPVAQDTMNHFAMAPNVKGVKVVAAKLGDYSVAMGAAKLGVDHVSKRMEKK